MRSKSKLCGALREALSQLSEPQAFVVAFSGGADSSVLLHALTRLRDRLPAPVRALHVNHNLHPDAARWAEECEQICTQWDVPFESLTVSVDPGRDSLEAAAREARYAAFATALGRGEILLTAHHRSDQAETLLLRLLRGTGVHGLKGIPGSRPLGQGFVARPFLNVGKTEILSYAHDFGLSVNEDPSNTDTTLDRNYLRHTVLPLLASRWPGYERTLARTAQLAAESAAIVDGVAKSDLEHCANSATSVSLQRLVSLPAPRQSQVLRSLMRNLGMEPPSKAQLATLLDSVSVDGNQAELIWGEWEARAYRDTLYLLDKLPAKAEGYQQTWSAHTEFDLPEGLGSLGLWSDEGPRQAHLPPQTFTVCFRQGGERIQLPQEPFHRKLKKLFQDAGIPPWVRDRTPLIYAGEALWAVGNRWHSGPCAAWLADHKIRLAWRNCTLVDKRYE